MKNKFRCMLCDKMNPDKNGIMLDISKDLGIVICVTCALTIYNLKGIHENEKNRQKKNKTNKKRKNNGKYRDRLKRRNSKKNLESKRTSK